MKVLVIRFSSIGDIVLTTPIVRCIKQQKPGAEVHFLTKESFRSIVAYNPYIDKAHYMNEDLPAVIEDLKKEKFDVVIDLHRNIRSARVKKALKTKSYTFDKLNIRKWLLVNFKMDTMPDKSIVDRYFECIRPLGIKNDGQGLDYFVPKNAVLKNSDLPMSHWAGYVACVIGGSYNTKKLPVEKWREFISKVPYPVILLGGPEDREEGQQIAEGNNIKVYNSCGKFNLNESAYIVEKAKVIVSNDTGLMHVAAAFNKPVISLWGNTSPEMGMFPYYGYNNLNTTVSPNSIILENKGLSCHPCSKLGYNKCPKGHFKCMKELNMNDLTEFVKKLWNTSQR
ncbi:glycosyltransferase family 9 protein [Polluticoccus soli]|uniref:glycosyltransferase family 9 protein n=1 Tax=Polluticoccus soli TaxID=3034150 RepID=UPI0023E09B15|nr:glycosyltransferase family 9 protein [Flavipsychrobacter sp. JY13-12]